MWKLILEAFKIIHHKDSTVKCQDIYEQTLKLSYIDLHTRYSTIEKIGTHSVHVGSLYQYWPQTCYTISIEAIKLGSQFFN